MGVKDRIEKYRAFAKEARRQAALTDDRRIKQGFVDLAKQWDEMAEHLLQSREPKS
jgi:hypothetical protein